MRSEIKRSTERKGKRLADHVAVHEFFWHLADMPAFMANVRFWG